jgi:heat-inducible transcriptional repressor
MTKGTVEGSPLAGIDERAREILKKIVESYLATGEPAGSRNISRIIPMPLSPASVRNVMSDLEAAGLLYSPHASAGRLPTQRGLRFFVDALLEFGDLADEERRDIEAQIRASGVGQTLEDTLAQASNLLSGLSRGAGVVVTTKANKRLKHFELVRLDPGRALAILVGDDGDVENRILPLPEGLPSSALVEATNYVNARLRDRTIGELKQEIELLQADLQQELDQLTAKLVQGGLAIWSETAVEPQLIVRGQSNLLADVTAAGDLERIRQLFADLETQREVVELLGRAEAADGVRIFIGSENQRFSLSGSSMIAAPFRDASQKIVGVLGVIGPTRLNYGRIVPMVDYTAKVVSRLIETRGGKPS